MTKADKYREAWLKMAGDPYKLGYEGNPDDVADTKYDVGDPAGSNPKWGDCSGDFWSALIYAGARLNWNLITKKDRHTADTWYHMGAPIPQPTQVGDAGFLVDHNGHAYHMFAYIGKGQVGEMGYNHVCRITTVAAENARGARWRRFGFDLGYLTTATPLPTLVIPPQVQRGSKGIYVYQLQAALNKLDYWPKLVVDGDFGSKTYAGVIWAQRKFGLMPIGVCGRKTWAAILAAVAKL
jgi:hypothetical protein